jgi:tetratricopeptide (TPR) repeat protein
MVTPEGEGARRASIYMRIGEVKRRQHKPREAELNFEKALEIDRKNREAHEALIRLADDANDHRRVVTLRKRAREALEDATQLALIADVLETKLGDPKAAMTLLEEARGLLPGDASVLQRLRRLYEAKERWKKLAEVTGELALAAADAKERAGLRFAQADVTLGRLLDEERGLSILEAVLEDDPAHDKALNALSAVRTRRKEVELLDKTYAKLVDRFAVSGDAERAWQTCKKMGLLRRDAMGDARGAVDAFQGAVRCKPSDVESRAALADLWMTQGDLDAALGELVRMSRLEPLRVATYRKLYELHTKAGRTDRAWLAATALEELGAADIDHHLVVDQYRAHHTEVVRPTAVFDERIWREEIRAEGADEAVAAILRTVGRAAAELRVSTLRKEKKLLSLSPQRKQAETSTASIVRTFVWASHVLDVPLPELYLYDDVPGGLAAVQGDVRATAIGPSVLTGLPLSDLAFLVARHLTYYRPEHYALVFYPTLQELLQLFLTAVELGLPSMPLSSKSGATGKKLVKTLDKLLTDAEREELVKAAGRFEEAGGRVDLAGWIRGVELTATRAGFALAGDLAVAMRVMRRETRNIADVSMDDRRSDLIAYSASEPFAKLREELSLTAKPGAF